MIKYLLIALWGLCLSGNVYASQGTVALRTATLDFVESLNAGQRKTAMFALKDDVRATWSNLPTLMAPPAGLLLKDLNVSQRAAVHRMLRASLSSQGYAKTAAIMWLDDVLHEADTRRMAESAEARANPFSVAMTANRDSGNYAVAVFGNPSDLKWGWKITGHHLAVNITVAEDQVGFMPVFLGSNPMIVKDGPYAGWMALPREGSIGIEMMRSLTPAQQSTARIGDVVPGDVFEGPGRRASLEKFEGLSSRTLNPDQRERLKQLVGEYVSNANSVSAHVQLDAIDASGWDNLWFSWRGPIDINGRFYYRVHGPRILIEYNRQNENHDHAVVRDPENDYGEDWLGHHYTEFHPKMEQVMRDVRKRLGIEAQ
ncbi:MAG: DUF3500 domain-containing protein [Gammaproteobacteria bacterium]|nr:MAG: DUF3500 domain-containing protein [Gammaproteobacteria bacterium]